MKDTAPAASLCKLSVFLLDAPTEYRKDTLTISTMPGSNTAPIYKQKKEK